MLLLIRYAAALVVIGYGLAHLPGAVVAWGRAEVRGVPAVPVWPPGVRQGGGRARALATLWLLAGLALVVSGAGIAVHAAWWKALIGPAAVVSAGLCLIWGGAARVGLVLSLAILGGLALSTLAGLHV